MGYNWFKKPGNLTTDKNKDNGSSFLKPAGDLTDNGMSYFQRGGSLEEPKKTNESFLQPAGDLEDIKVNDNESSYFQIAGDLDTPKQTNSFTFEEKNEQTLKTPEEIKAWLKTIVSGKKKSNYEFGKGKQAFSSGRILVGLDELKEMVESGDNIISAEYLEALNMVDIEFESFKLPSKSR